MGKEENYIFNDVICTFFLFINNVIQLDNKIWSQFYNFAILVPKFDLKFSIAYMKYKSTRTKLRKSPRDNYRNILLEYSTTGL